MKKSLKFTACGLFIKETVLIDTIYSEGGMNSDGSIRCIETTKQAATYKPVLVWNPKKYNKEIYIKAQS